jgi:hypothetical protein
LSIDGTITELPQGISVPTPFWIPKIPNRIKEYGNVDGKYM